MVKLNVRAFGQAKLVWLLGLGLVLRVAVALSSDQIHQPDEVFSYLEQAHRLVFGYGVIPWEYRYGIRSWIIPDILAGLLAGFRLLGIDNPNQYTVLIKLIFCVVSLSLIYATYVSVQALASEAAATLAAFVVAVWYEFLYFASKPTPEVLATYFLIGAFALAVAKPRIGGALACGLLCGIAAILRFQYLPATLVLIGIALWRWRTAAPRRMGLAFAAFNGGFLLPVFVAGLVDYFTWGGFLVSYYNSFVFQSVYRVSDLFGIQPAGYFPATLAIASCGLFAVAVVVACAPSKLHKTWPLLLVLFGILLPHSLVAHKEYRFVFAAIPLLVMITALVIADSAAFLKTHLSVRQKGVFGATAILVTALSVGGILLHLPFEYLIYGHMGTISQTTLLDREGVLSAYLYLYDDPDTAAVAETYAQWYLTGGYYYLHRNIPVYLPGQLSRIAPRKDYINYVSHVICNRNDPPIPGFRTVARYGNVEVRKAETLRSNYLALKFDNLHPYQPGVDNRFHAQFNTVAELPRPVSKRQQ